MATVTVANLDPALDLVSQALLQRPALNRTAGSAEAPSPRSEPAYRISLSDAARDLTSAQPLREPAQALDAEAEDAGPQALSPEEQREVDALERRDREVRAHEAAHKAAAGSLSSGGPSYSYTTGPDGQRYATSGEVAIDTAAVSGDPDATVRKMQQVRAAALAPASPSAQDRRVAAQAAATAQAARSEIQETKATGCPVCGGEGHGPEGHDRANTPAVDLTV